MSQAPITIITPCYNENVIAIKFLETLEHTLSSLPYNFCVVVVNDCSTDDTLALLKRFSFISRNLSLKIINLKFNVGHQVAIYQGFLYASSLNGDHFIVMDSDGEDSPAAIPGLLACLDTDIVNVVRSNRRESIFFRFCYRVYKIMFRLVTGKQMNFGNFCLISRQVMEHAVFTTFSHFAAFLSKQKCNTRYIVAPKEERLGGHSKMGYKKLFYHAIKSFIEYGENILMIFFKGGIFLALLLLICIGNAGYKKFVAHAAIPVWTGVVMMGLINLAVMCIGFFVLGLLLIHLYKRNPNSKIPIYELCTSGNTEEAV